MVAHRTTHYGIPTKTPRPQPDKRLPVPPAARPRPVTVKPTDRFLKFEEPTKPASTKETP